ncbi:MAG: cupin domain-containing protein [Parcubacteria group bacterium]
MTKIIAMIPARLGSKRVKHKNLRLLAGKTLSQHVAEKCKQSGVFSDIYINSEADVFEKIATDCGVKFYKRPERMAADDATNDMFVQDFVQNVPCDIIIQVNPTSPLISAEDIKKFVAMMVDGDYDTLHSVKEEQIEGLYDGRPLNFDLMKPMPRSQDLKPVMLFSSGVMGWRVNKYLDNMKKLNCATYGGDGKTGYFVLEGFSTIDIDHEEDFQMAEVVMQYLESSKSAVVQYYDDSNGSKGHSEVDVPAILLKDGVAQNDLFDVNNEIVSIQAIIDSFPKDSSWSKRIVDSKSNSATLIAQMPGEGNRLHFHPDWDEWWYIIAGEWDWTIEGAVKRVKAGDVVWISRNKKHKITAAGNTMAIRLAVSRSDVAHVYDF